MASKKGLVWVGAIALLLSAAPAKAQFANWGLGLSLGYDFIVKDNVDLGVPFALRGSYYVGDGFELTAVLHLQYVRLTGVLPDALGLIPQLGFRYLFLQETIRPYIGADLSYWHIFSKDIPGVDLVGVGPKAGCEFFTSDSFSLGVEASAGFFFALNLPVDYRISLLGTATIYF